jgi:hypothetical protein
MERFDHRTTSKLESILNHSRHSRIGEINSYGDIEEHANKFEIRDSMMEKIFEGNLEETLRFIRTLK